MNLVKYLVAFVIVASLIYFGLVAMSAFTPEAFALLSASLLAIVFERLPWLKDAWDELDADGKQLGMWIMLFVLVGGAYGLSCAGILTAFACTGAGVAEAFVVLFLAIAFNQGAHRIVKKKTPI